MPSVVLAPRYPRPYNQVKMIYFAIISVHTRQISQLKKSVPNFTSCSIISRNDNIKKQCYKIGLNFQDRYLPTDWNPRIGETHKPVRPVIFWSDWQAIECLLDEINRRMPLEGQNILMTESAKTSIAIREKLTQTMFETYNVNAFYLAKQVSNTRNENAGSKCNLTDQPSKLIVRLFKLNIQSSCVTFQTIFRPNFSQKLGKGHLSRKPDKYIEY